MQYISPSCKSVLGFSPDEFNDKHFSILFHKDDIEEALQDFKWVLLERRSGRSTYCLKKKMAPFIG
ncbi:PAS domain-containing protein [Neobacillus sp. PS3-12]|uniref:PAS domain-containing protein n=1 Tax=Neobacillus sp. PS3-12 TaxID=3070677 RepID=UPI0035A8AE9A